MNSSSELIVDLPARRTEICQSLKSVSDHICLATKTLWHRDNKILFTVWIEDIILCMPIHSDRRIKISRNFTCCEKFLKQPIEKRYRISVSHCWSIGNIEYFWVPRYFRWGETICLIHPNLWKVQTYKRKWYWIEMKQAVTVRHGWGANTSKA